VWRTDGTVCGTHTVEVGAGEPFALEGIGADLVFGGYTLETGHEPHVYHNINSIARPSCEGVRVASQGDDLEVTEKILTPYPNPFTQTFTLRINGKEGEKAEVGVFTASGMPVDNFPDVKVNTEYENIGGKWQKGFYIVKVIKGDKIETYQVIKQ
jgi:hypothetical protein